MEKQGYLQKLYYRRWVIGITRGNIGDIIRTKNFRQDNIKWIKPGSADRFYADPFIMQGDNGEVDILYEEFNMEKNYGNISVMSLDERFEVKSTRLLLDTGSHLSFPFMFRENNRIFVFPESVRSGIVSCYEYLPADKTLKFRGEIMKSPLYDPVIMKMDDRYWLFGSVFENRKEYKLYVFYSDRLMGPYTPIRGNPVRSGLNGIRGAGNFIEVDGDLYRPAQNCEIQYGDSITINKLKVLDEFYFSEEPYMTINISRKNMEENNIHTIHTLNCSGDLIVVDGVKWTFSPMEKWKDHKRRQRLSKQTERIEP